MTGIVTYFYLECHVCNWRASHSAHTCPCCCNMRQTRMLLQRHPEHMPENTLVHIMELLFGEYATAWHKGHLPEVIRHAPLLRQMETTTIILPTAATMVTKATTNQHPDWQEIQTMQRNTALWLVHYLHSPYLLSLIHI